MVESERVILFLCSSALKNSATKLSHRIASQLEMMGIAEIGNLEKLSAQRSVHFDLQKKMIFINGCRSGCLRLLTHGFNSEKYLFINVSTCLNTPSFNIREYIDSEILPMMHEKWNFKSTPSNGAA